MPTHLAHMFAMLDIASHHARAGEKGNVQARVYGQAAAVTTTYTRGGSDQRGWM